MELKSHLNRVDYGHFGCEITNFSIVEFTIGSLTLSYLEANDLFNHVDFVEKFSSIYCLYVLSSHI